MDNLQNEKSLKLFKDFVVQGQGLEVQGKGQGLRNWSSRTRTFLEDYTTTVMRYDVTLNVFVSIDCSSNC